MVRFKNRRKLQRRIWIAFKSDEPDPEDNPSGEPEPSSPSGGDNSSAAARRVASKTSMKREIQELKQSMAEINALLKHKADPQPPEKDKKKPQAEDSSQLKASLDALQTRLVQVEKNLEQREQENARLLQESLRTRFLEGLNHPEMETRIKPSLARFLFSELESRLAFDPENPGEIRVKYRDPATGKVAQKAFQEIVDEERKAMRPVTLVEFLNEELQKPEYKDFWAVPGTQDPGFTDAGTPPRGRKDKLTPEEAHDQRMTQERSDPGAMARRFARAKQRQAEASA